MENIKLIKGDCLEIMKKMPDNFVDLIVTSPPYNKKGLIGKKNKGNQIWNKFNINYNSYDDNMKESDYIEWQISIINEMIRIIKNDGSIFYNHKPRRYKNKSYLPFEFINKSNAILYQLIIWDRKNSPNIRNDIFVPSTEHLYWIRKNKPKTFRQNVDKNFLGEVWTIPPNKQKKHPAPFPEKLVENCIKMTTNNKNHIVMDPFMGSGTTGIVCKKLNRKFIGIEIDNKYYNLSKYNIENI